MTEFFASSAPLPGGVSGEPNQAPPRHRRATSALGRTIGAAGLATAVLAALSLATWSATDPSLTHLSTAKPTNALGTFGAIFSDLALTSLGLAAVIGLLPPLFWAMQLVTGATVTRFKLRALAAPLVVLTLASALAGLPRIGAWPLPSGYGGLLGDLISALLIGAAGLVVADGASLLATGVAMAASLALLPVALGLSRAELKAMARFAARPFEPDSSWVAGLKQATSGQQGSLPTLAAATPPDLSRPGFAPPPLSLTPEHQADWTSHHGRHDGGYRDQLAPAYVGAMPPLAPVAAVSTIAPSAPLHTAMAAPVPPPAPYQAPLPPAPLAAPAMVPVQVTAAAPAIPPRPHYALPPTSLLSPSSKQRASALEMDLAEKLRGDRLRDVLASFAVPGAIVSHWTGPVVTTFVFEPQAGTKTARVLGLADDIARHLGVTSIRLQLAAGRGSLLIEVPHDDAIAIGLRDLVEHEAYSARSMRLPLALGATAQGEPAVVDLASVASLLIAGKHAEERAGTLRALVAGLAYRHTPEALSIAVADADGSLGALAALPHCGGHAPTLTPTESIDLLTWAASEIDTRSLRLRAAAQSRSIEAYNARVASEPNSGLAPMAYLVIVLADLAPLAAADSPAFDDALHRIVRDGMAVGVHVLAATSRTDDGHFSEGIKAAFQTRLAMKLASRSDSRAVLDQTGAEELIGQGDTLAMTSNEDARRLFGGGTLSRLHLTRVSFDEALAITAACQPTLIHEEPAQPTAVHTPIKTPLPQWKPAAAHIDDALYGRAISLVRRVQSIDAGMFRRGLAVSYAEAMALLDRLVIDRVVGPEEADGTHRVLIGRAA